MRATVTVKLSTLKKWAHHLHEHPRVARALDLWSLRMRTFWRVRFINASRGDGTWPPLKQGTLFGRSRRPYTRLSKAYAAGEITDEQLETRMRRARRAVAKRQAKIRATPMGPEYARLGGILWDTGTLLAALDPSVLDAPGSLHEASGLSVTVGYGGMDAYPDGKATIADVARFHQEGGGNLPRREIIVPPDSATLAAMCDDMQRAVSRL